MKTFLGFHYPSTGNRDDLGLAMNAGANGICTYDCGFPKIAGQFRATRFSVEGQDNPQNFYTNPRQAALDWFRALQPAWSANPGADCRIVNNELDIETPWHATQQNIFYLQFMQLCDTVGVKAGICSYAGGNPSDNPLVDGTPCSLEERWRPLLPAIKYAGDHGHYVVLHIHQQDHGNMETPGGQQVSLRHRRSIAYWLNNALHPECQIGRPPQVVFNEVSNGVGGVEPTENEYLASIIWLDQTLRADPYNALYTVIGLYQAGGAERLTRNVYRRIANYVDGLGEIQLNPYPTGSTTGEPLPPPPLPMRFEGTCPPLERYALIDFCKSHNIKLNWKV